MRPWPRPTCRCGCGRSDAGGDRYGAKGMSAVCYKRVLRRSKRKHGLGQSPLADAIRRSGVSAVAKRLGVTEDRVRWWVRTRHVAEAYQAEVVAFAETLDRREIFDDSLPSVEDVAWGISEVVAFRLGEP